MLEARYAGFVTEPTDNGIRFDVEIVPSTGGRADEELEVRTPDGHWRIQSRRFSLRNGIPASYAGMRAPGRLSLRDRLGYAHRAQPGAGAEPRRILVIGESPSATGKHSCSREYPGAGKTPYDFASGACPTSTPRTDEISYVCLRASGDLYVAFGTPFAGDLGSGDGGEHFSAPTRVLYLLEQGNGQQSCGPDGAADGARRLLRNVLFFADDSGLVEGLFRTICEFVSRVPVYELTFRPEPEVWDLIR